jgi:phage gp45-like
VLSATGRQEKTKMVMMMYCFFRHDIQTVQLMTHAGDDINPPDGSRIVVLSVGRAYKIAIASEDGIEPEVAPGEREIYSSVDGARMARVRLTSEGLVVIQNQDESLLQILSDLINTLVTITTFGSPVKHVLSNDSQDALNDIKDRLSSLLGEI